MRCGGAKWFLLFLDEKKQKSPTAQNVVKAKVEITLVASLPPDDKEKAKIILLFLDEKKQKSPTAQNLAKNRL